jgi:hypothetical protein
VRHAEAGVDLRFGFGDRARFHLLIDVIEN